MSEYKHTVSKADITGFAQDPSQSQSNASSPMLDAPMTARSTVIIGAAAIYGKRVFSSGFKAVIGQFGNSQLEDRLEIGSKILTYGGLAVISPAAAGLSIFSDIAIGGINSAVASYAIKLDNERLVEERGTTMQLGAGDYFG